MRTERNFYQTTKAAFAFAFTTATYLLARTTGFLPSWFAGEMSTEGAVTSFEQNAAAIPPDNGYQLVGQRRLLQAGGGVTVANPIPDQVIQVNQQYTYSLDQVFSGNYSLLGAVETGQSSLPSWLSLQPKLLSTMSYGSTGVLVNGSILFVLNQLAAIQILNVSNTSNPTPISSFTPGGFASGIAISGSIIFLTVDSLGLKILDMSNLTNPKVLSNYSSASFVRGVVVSDSTAFLAYADAGLQILNVSNTSNPRLLSIYPAGSGSVLGVAVNGNTAYVLMSVTNSIQILDVSNLTNPRLLSNVSGIAAQSLAVNENMLFVANSANLLIFNVSDPSNPKLLSSYPAGMGGGVYGVTLSGNIAFVADSSAGLKILDVSNPTNPQLLSNYPEGGGVAQGVSINGNIIFLANSLNVKIFNVSQASLIGLPPVGLVGQEVSVTVSARNINRQLASDQFKLVLDQFPRVVQSSVTDQSIYPGNSMTLLLNSELLFVNPSNSFLKLSLKLSNEMASTATWLRLDLQPVELSTCSTGLGGNSAVGVMVSGNTAFVAIGIGLQIFDVSNPSNPQLLSTYPAGSGGYAQRVAINGSTVFVAVGAAGLQILDVSNPSNPRLLSNYSAGYTWGVAISGNTAVVAVGAAGLRILDMSNLTNPQLLSNYSAGNGTVNDVVLSGNTAFLIDSTFSAPQKFLDISNPRNPQLRSTYPVPGFALGAAMSGSTAFVGGLYIDLQMINVSNISNPVRISTYNAQGVYSKALAISGSILFVAYGNAGLQIVDVSNLTSPRLFASYSAGTGIVNQVAINGNRAFVADGTVGLQILDLSQWQLTARPTTADVGNYRMQLIATDELGGSASTQPFTIRVEGPPQITGNISTQYARVGQFFNYFMPQGLFVDPNFDPISFTASLVDGTSLPSWLAFNGISAAFAGTPTSAANITILLRATDNIAGSVNTTFNIVTSYLPVADLPIAEQIGRIGAPYYFRTPSSAFFDQDGDIVNYTAQRANGQPLPSWLRFNATVQSFSGYPNQTQAGQYDLQIVATDRYSGQASTVFTLWVEYFPVVNQTLVNQMTGVGDLFSFALPPLAFTDADSSQLSYRARRPDGSLLPNWLAFNPQTLIFNGQPLSSDRGVLTVQVVASDPLGASATQNFNITIVDVPTLGTHIPRQLLNVGVFNQFQIPSSAFNYAGSDALRYSAYQQGNQSLPTWLQFNNVSLIFSGTPQSNQTGDYSLSVVAQDNYAHAVSNAFDLVVERFPVVNQSIAPVSGSVGNPMTFTISSAAFADPDGDPLTYSARRADGSALPNWLTFDGLSRVFSGIPVVTDIGAMTLQISATDSLGGSAQQNMTLNILYAPVINTPPPALKPLREERRFNLTLSPQTFSDPGGAALNYSASQVDGSPLPSWLTFFPPNLSLSGTPAISDVGTLSMLITATNPQGAYVNLPLSLVIWNNYPPQVMQTLSNQLATVLNAFQFFAPPDTFSDVNEDTLRYTATQVNGQPLPGWLRFDAQRLGFFGTPSRSDTGNFAARVIPVALTAHDDKSSTSTQFNISVQGTSSVALFLQVIIPLLSGLVTGYGAYKNRALLLNCYKPQRYQRLEEKPTVGEHYEYELKTPKTQVKKVQVFIPHPRKDCLRIFMSPYRPLPGGLDLPTWLSYDTNANILRSKGPIPATALPHLIVQVRGKDDVILEQFPLHIARDPGDAKELGAVPTLAGSPALPGIGDEEGIEMQVVSNMEMTL